ncbi:hypothetical protein [Actinacidiphila sp. bgisy160]|uniref:hypothetical protein n=1 Tax=Actinacidiphila sp. bgisy160 TaxID=3413796 RepID=UPI003D704017
MDAVPPGVRELAGERGVARLVRGGDLPVGLAARVPSCGTILWAGPVIAKTTGSYGEGATFLLLATAAGTGLPASRPRAAQR